jgi:hypothetical protein
LACVFAREFLRAHAGEALLELMAVSLLALAGSEKALAGVGEMAGVAVEVLGRGRHRVCTRLVGRRRGAHDGA